MFEKHKLIAKSAADIPAWQQALTEHFGFSQVHVSVPDDIPRSVYKGSLRIDTYSEPLSVKIAKIDSTPQITRFIHQDCCDHNKQHCILIHSLSSLCISAKNRQIYLPYGGYVVIPAWEPYTVKSQSHRYGLTFVINLVAAGFNPLSLTPLFWRIGNYLRYGNMINNLLSDYYAPLTGEYAEQLISTLKNLFLLQCKYACCPCNFNKTLFTPNLDISAITDVIRRNMTDPGYSLGDLVNYYEVSERVLQLRLARYGFSFTQLLALSRCELLAMTIRTSPDINPDVAARSCGFTSLRMADRQFKKFYLRSVTQFQKEELTSSAGTPKPAAGEEKRLIKG